MLDEKIIPDLEKKVIVSNDPFPHTVINNFLPLEIAKKAEKEFIDLKKSTDSLNIANDGPKEFMKKKSLSDYSRMPSAVKQIVDFLYSKDFLDFLERKFQLKNLEADWTLHGGGMHESFKGGFLKVHSDFIYMRKSKLKRRLNLLLYLNSNWKENWGGSVELWDKEMKSAQKAIPPKMNNAVIFRTDFDSNHGFPEPINCPDNTSRKSLALYYYTREKTILPISLKRRKLFHAVWKKRPNVNEIKFADNDPFFKRLKHKFFYRFF